MRPATLLSLFLRQFALAFVAIALLVQAAIPAGYMAAPSDGAFPFAVVMCGDGAAGDHQAPTDQDDSTAPCVFAGFGAGIVTPDLPSVSFALVSYTVAEFTPAPSRAALTVGAGAPPPSRAPPSFI